MNIHEYQAKELLRNEGVPIPPGEVATTADEAERIARQYGGTVVVKAQVHAGGRGKAGGVKLAKSSHEAKEIASKILGMQIKGLTVEKVLVTAAGPAIVQALLLISIVFGFTWWLGGRLGLEDKLRALLASAVSICGVSAAIAAAGAVQAKREQLAYAASLVIAFALPSIFLLPWLADVFNLSDAVAGAWIGGNIDTTAAVAASGAIAGENALQIATIVKTTQNALIGVVAIALTAYFALKVERKSASDATPTLGQFWERFPKFVLGFIAASVTGTLYVQWAGKGSAADIATVNDLRTWFLIFAFVSIGLEFSLKGLRDAGWRPIAVFASATVVNIVVALGLATVLFGNFQVG